MYVLLLRKCSKVGITYLSKMLSYNDLKLCDKIMLKGVKSFLK